MPIADNQQVKVTFQRSWQVPGGNSPSGTQYPPYMDSIRLEVVVPRSDINNAYVELNQAVFDARNELFKSLKNKRANNPSSSSSFNAMDAF
jgi:hypothetical protein